MSQWPVGTVLNVHSLRVKLWNWHSTCEIRLCAVWHVDWLSSGYAVVPAFNMLVFHLADLHIHKFSPNFGPPMSLSLWSHKPWGPITASTIAFHLLLCCTTTIWPSFSKKHPLPKCLNKWPSLQSEMLDTKTHLKISSLILKADRNLRHPLS